MAKRIDRGVGNINDFPDDVLCYIISFLPTKDAVCTSILSTRWRNLFALLSNLDLEVYAGDVEELKGFMNFVDGLMIHLNIPSMVRFRLRYGGYVFSLKKSKCGASVQRVGDWICSLVRHKIQELDIEIESGVYNCLILPPMLFSCESLVVLKLSLRCRENNMVRIPDRIYLPNLKIIHFKWTKFSNDAEKLFSSCPVLEDLVLDHCFLKGVSVRFSVSNQNLKTLTLKDIFSEGGSMNTCIVINAPSLIILNHDVSDFYSLEFIDVKSLSEAILTSFTYERDAFLNATPDAFGWIPNVETLRICFFIARELQRSKVPIPLFENMTYLKIWFQECCFDYIGFDPIGLEYFLARCVVLETLVFEESRMLHLRRTNYLYSLQESQLAPLLHHLKTIEIWLLDIGHMVVLMKVIKFFLKNAKVLEVLKISSKQGWPEEQSKITRMLTNYPRASKKCRVLFYSNTSK